MYLVDVYKSNGPETILSPLDENKKWINQNPYAYYCLPVAMPSKFGWAISFPKDISFVWGGGEIDDPNPNINVLEGNEYCFFDRQSSGVITFATNLIFKTDEKTSILQLPVPNQFISGAQCFTSIISSSFYTSTLHVVWRITSRNETIKIKAGTPVATIIPISLNQFQNSTAVLHNSNISNQVHDDRYMKAMNEYSLKNNKLPGWYKKGIDQYNNIIGKHEINSFKFKVKNKND